MARLRLAFRVGDEADAAGIAFASWVVQVWVSHVRLSVLTLVVGGAHFAPLVPLQITGHEKRRPDPRSTGVRSAIALLAGYLLVKT